MITPQRSPQNHYLFGPARGDWHVLPRDVWSDLRIPAHLEDQVFRISLAVTPGAHFFELQVSEQCPRETYTRLARCLAALHKERLVISVVHARGAGVHLIFWRRANPEQFHHLDMEPARPSLFDQEVLAALRRPAPRRMRRLFELMEGQSLGRSFFVTLRRHIGRIPCDTEQAYYAVVDLLLKLIFLIFVERKRWLNFDPCYLENKMAACDARGLSIVTAFLTPLFATLEGLPVRADLPLGALPHLGGGMFTFRPTDLPRIENHVLLDLCRDLTSRYSFSLFEALQGRKILGVSPDMLGHVFENLLLGDDRKAHGTYYTPLHVAQKQVGAALEAWRAHHCPGADAWREALPTLRLLDPSCGSGTYLVAAFNALVKARLDFLPACERYNGKLFALKREVVLHNLYGVDIHPMAVRLAEVRLWLNMIQDLEVDAPGDAPALPNLKHHLRPGDFLARHLTGDVARIRTWPKYAVLERVRRRFPHAGPRARPAVLRHMYRLEGELETWLLGRALDDHHAVLKTRAAQAVLPGHQRDVARVKPPVRAGASPMLHVVFSRVFLDGGFHLVVGNPPWLRASGLSKAQKATILANLEAPRDLVLDGQVDLSLYFTAACLKLLRPGGHLGFLLPGKVLRCRYARGLRAWMMRRCRLNYLFDYGIDQKLLFDADTFPLALGVTRAAPDADHLVRVERYGRSVTESFSLPQPLLADARGTWMLQRPTEHEAMYGWPRLADLPPRVRRGVVTGAKAHFTFAAATDQVATARLRPLLRGRDIQPHRVAPGRLVYWPFGKGGDWWGRLPAPERAWLGATGKLRTDGARPRLPYRPRALGPWVVIWKYLARSWQPALLPGGDWVPDQTTYYIDFEAFEEAYRYYAWFHSPRAARWIAATADRGKDRHLFFYAHTVKGLPVPPDLASRALEIPAPRPFLPGQGVNLWPRD